MAGKKRPSISRGQARLVGKRYSRRTLTTFVTEHGPSESYSLVRDDYLSLDRYREEAIAVLKSGGYQVDRLLAADPGGGFLFDEVRWGTGPDDPGEEFDSPLRIAAELCYHCCQLKGWLQYEGASDRQIQHAYAIGRLVVLTKVYAVEDVRIKLIESWQRAGADENRKYSESDKARWRAIQAELPAHIAKSARSSAAWILKNEGLPKEAFDSVRRALSTKLGKPALDSPG
jgi:hypothetical protein